MPKNTANDPFDDLFADLSIEELKSLEKVMARSRTLVSGELDYRGRQTLIRTVDFRKHPERACSWKKHFKYASDAHELIGYLEQLEERFPRPDRFLFVSMDRLIKECFKGERAALKNFSRRQFYRSVDLLRSLGVLSPITQRAGREGLIVAPHAALCVRAGSTCHFVGATFSNREKAGLVGWFDICSNGYAIWHPDEEPK